MDPLSCTAPDTPWATLILSASLQRQAKDKVKAQIRPSVKSWLKLIDLPVPPEISVLAAEMLVHGVKRAHTTVFLQPDPIGEEVLTRGFSGSSQEGAHHDCGQMECWGQVLNGNGEGVPPGFLGAGPHLWRPQGPRLWRYGPRFGFLHQQ